MKGFEVNVFNIERGLCVFIHTPNDYGIMIDCGCSKSFSPTDWLLKHKVPVLNEWNGHKLAWLVVTHPHDDHVEDINKVKAKLSPAILLRHKDYDWNAVLNPPDGDPSENAKTYHQWQQTYNQKVERYPDLGLEFQRFSLSPKEAAEIDQNTQHLLNNSSYVSVFTYTPPGKSVSWKVVVAGDNETAGWEKLLKKEDFRKAIKGADFFVTAHHGHKSGFSTDLFEVMGKPIVNITSERLGDKSVHDYQDMSQGAKVNGETRYHLTTRCDGHITVNMNDELKYRIVTEV